MSEEQPQPKAPAKWTHPSEVMKLHQLKRKKKALQARINTQGSSSTVKKQSTTNYEDFVNEAKRKNPFITSSQNKRPKQEIDVEESSDQTLFKLFHLSNNEPPKNYKENLTNFNNLLKKLETPVERTEIKVIGEKWIPIDWALNSKVRFLSTKPFMWNSKLKTSDEASGITSFARCLDTNKQSSLDTSPNAKFHQCCLYWQQPCLPWLTLFPRTQSKASLTGVSVASNANIRDSLHMAFSDSFRSLFQLIRTRQCPYFYACVNSFTILFRAAGVCGFTEMQVLITPTTRGFRHMLRQENIEFTMPLKKKLFEDPQAKNDDKATFEDDDDKPVDDWLESMGVNSDEIRRINHVQDKVNQRVESEVDNSEQSLVLIEGLEIQTFYTFLINCKSITALTGPYAGIPPTLLAPVAFTGASLQALNVRESKVHVDHEDFYSLDLKGPILPHIIHKLCALHPKENSMTATFSNIVNTLPFSKITCKEKTENDPSSSSNVFNEENLSDCGLTGNILKHFCTDNPKHVSNFECIKYTSETNSYAWS